MAIICHPDYHNSRSSSNWFLDFWICLIQKILTASQRDVKNANLSLSLSCSEDFPAWRLPSGENMNKLFTWLFLGELVYTSLATPSTISPSWCLRLVHSKPRSVLQISNAHSHVWFSLPPRIHCFCPFPNAYILAWLLPYSISALIKLLRSFSDLTKTGFGVFQSSVILSAPYHREMLELLLVYWLQHTH